MKKIVNVNIGGVPFTLDEDAYTLLEQYLNTLHAIYHDEDADMVADIEARIGELLLQDVAEGRIVTISDVQREIDVIGDPKEFDDEETLVSESVAISGEGETITVETMSQAGSVPPPSPQQPPQIEHKLFRDPRNKMIAGVCSGIAVYNHLSVNTVRLLTVAAFFLTMFFPLGAAMSIWIVPIIYACFWIAVPEAQTPLQYMQLCGESGSMADVAKAVNNQYVASMAMPPRSESPAGFWTTVGNIIIAIVKGFFAFIAVVVGVPVLIGLICITIVLLVACIAQICAWIGNLDFGTTFPLFADMINRLPGNWGMMLAGLIFLLGALLIPGWFLLRSVFNWENKYPLTRRGRITWLVIWILCILLATGFFSMI